MYSMLEPTADMLESCLIRLYDFSSGLCVRPLKLSENLSFLVTDGTERSVLRVSRPGYHCREELEAEVCWINKLREDTKIAIAAPIAGKDGSCIQQTGSVDDADSCYLALFEFLEGTTLEELSGDALCACIRKLGRMSAILNLQVIGWKESATLPRMTWHFEDLFVDGRWGDYRDIPGLTKTQAGILERALVLIERRLRSYGKTPENYGLIHGDLNVNNVLLSGDTLQLIDFDDCGFGWFLWELGNAAMRCTEDLEAVKTAWLEGYQTERRLSAVDLAEVDTFILFKKIARLAWIVSHSGSDTVRAVAPDYLEHVVALADSYLRREQPGKLTKTVSIAGGRE